MEEVKEINDDIEKMEKDCGLINCVAIRDSIVDIFKLIRDIIKYFIFCKNKNE